MNAEKFALATAGIVLSLLGAFFLVFNGLFADGPKDPRDPERLVSLGLILVGYGLLGATGARIATPWWGWPVGLAVPGVATCILYSMREPSIGLLAVLEAVAALGGVLLGGRLARPRPVARPGPPGPPVGQAPAVPQQGPPGVRQQGAPGNPGKRP